jgi:putative flippase GtrA
VVAGAINTFFGLAIFPVLLWLVPIFRTHYLVALGICQAVSLCFAFATYMLGVFRTRANAMREFGMFSSFYLVNYAVNWIALPILVEAARITPIVAQLSFSIVLMVGSYFWHSRLTFKSVEGQVVSNSSYKSRSCPVCRSSSFKEEVHSTRRAETMSPSELRPFWSGFFKEKVFFTYSRCEICGLLFAPDFFSNDQLGDLYSQMAPNMDLVPSDAIGATQRGYFSIASNAGRLDGGYLEIGPDVGYIVNLAVHGASFGHFWLFEPNRAVHEGLAAATEGRPHTILTDMMDLSCVPDASIGLAMMVHVLDHLLDPMDMLQQIRAKLKPGGVLAIVTHNEASLLRMVMGKRWPPFCLQHPEVYSPKSMTKMMERVGFQDFSVKRSKNYFPISFLVRQAAWAVGLNFNKVPLPTAAIGLRLGNIITLASR